MPVSGPKIGAHFLKMARTIEGASVETVTAAAAKAADEQNDRIRRDSGGDGVLSNVGAGNNRAGGTKVGVRVKVDKSKSRPSALIAATGPLQIINNDTAGHVIRSTRAKGRGRKGFVGPTLPGQFGRGKQVGPSLRPVINIPGVGARASARHPGTKGKNTWQDGRRKAEPIIAKAMRQTTFNVVKGAAKP
jgi:hypothetical protein